MIFRGCRQARKARSGSSATPEGKLMRVSRLKELLLSLVATALLACSLPCAGEAVPFSRAIDLALQHSGMMAVSAANQRKASDLYEQARAAYLPTITFGSGLGYSIGIPPSLEGSAPSLFNIVSQQSLLNYAQRDFVRAARNDLKATHFDAANKREDVILETATAYIDLDVALRKLEALGDAAQAARRAGFITSERLKEGIDSQLDLKKAQLNVAKVNMRVAEAQTAADVARQRLARLTGLAAGSIETVSSSIPASPEIDQDADLPARAARNNPVVQLAQQKVISAQLRARAETRVLYPSIDIASQYERLSSTLNNYEQYYKNFHAQQLCHRLVDPGSGYRFCAACQSQCRRGRPAAGQANAQMTQDQVEENVLQMQRSLRQIAAGSDVARLEYEVSQAAIDAVRAKLATGQANARDQENALLDSSERYSAYLDAQLQLTRATMQLMRQTGELDSWALPQKP